MGADIGPTKRDKVTGEESAAKREARRACRLLTRGVGADSMYFEERNESCTFLAKLFIELQSRRRVYQM